MKKIIPVLVLSGIVAAGLLVGLLKGQELKQRWAARKKASPQERELMKKGNVNLDEYEIESWHG